MPRPHLSAHLSSLARSKSSTTIPPTSAAPGNSAAKTDTSRNPSPSRNGPVAAAPPKSPGSELKGDHRNMGLVVRAHVLKGRNLAPKDKSGTSDPYLVISLGESRQATSVVSKTLQPEWNQTFDFPITSPDSALIEATCWDKDLFKNDYMGEFDVMLEELFHEGSTTPEPRWFKLESRRSGRKKKKDDNISGEIMIRFTLFDPTNTAANAQQVLQKFYGVVAETAEDDEDEEEILKQLNSRGSDYVSEEEEEEDDREPSDETDDGLRTPEGTISEEKRTRRRREKIKRVKRRTKIKAYEFSGMSDVAGVLFLEINRITDLPPEKNLTRTTFDMDPFVVTSLGKKTYRTRVVNHNLNPVYDEKLVFQVQKHEQNYSLSFAVVDRDKLSGNDFVGTALFPVEKVRSVAPEADPESGLYRLPDPDNVTDADTRRRKWRVPMSRSTSQTNASGRISRNNSGTNLSKLTKTASNSSLNGGPPKAGLRRVDSDNISEQARPAPTSAPSQAGTSTSIPEDDQSDDQGLISYEIPLDLKNKSRWEDKHSPVLYLKARYLPYQALRQQFWRVMLRQYDADESGKIDKIELVTMLDSLGSTLRNSTIDSFFSRWNQVNGGEEILTMDQAVICLEEQLAKTQARPAQHSSAQYAKAKLSAGLGLGHQSSPDAASGVSTPEVTGNDRQASDLSSSTTSVPTVQVSDLSEAGERGEKLPEDDLASGPALEDVDPEAQLSQDQESTEEHVVEIHECPVCHQPRLARGRRTTDADIITHIATCASSDWRSVNNLVMAGFVTSSQAQRKWYSKIISKVSYGGYRLGANSANILVQDRLTGMINEERMSVYVRLGIRLLYKGLKSREMEKKKARKLLRSLSFKQGRKYDDPASAAQIPGFVNFHQLDMGEVLLPLNEFKTFNEFFYRALKPSARPCSAPDDPNIVVSPADCRSVVFNQLEDAQRIWVKGREFSVERLLGEAFPEDAQRYQNGALGIFRLAPQDYHRFHIPVDGVMGEPKLIDGEYYTVNPMAIRSALDVYGENIRVCVPIDSVCHGRVMVICVGAMMVGSTVITRQAGDQVKRAEELGYFKFGGSTILCLFEPGVMKFDDDLIDNSNGALETLVRVGMSIGHSPSQGPHTPDMKKDNPTQAEKQEAKRRIEGSLAPSSAHDPLADIQ
nr:phosphatidylserine decarboxylase proenzyme 3 [Quercus suber]